MATDVITGVLGLAGAFFTLLAGIGVLKFPDTLSRMQAVTKATAFGLLLIIAATLVTLRMEALRLALALGLVFFIAPMVAHLVGRSAYHGDAPNLDLDELDQSATTTAPHPPGDEEDRT